MPNELRGKRAAIIAADDFEDLELFHPLYRLQEEGIKTIVVGITREPIKGKRGYSFTPDVSIDDVHSKDFDFLVIPGGNRQRNCDSTTRSLGSLEISTLKVNPLLPFATQAKY